MRAAALLAVGAALYWLMARGKEKLPDESLPEMAEAASSLPDVPAARVVKDDKD